MENIKTATGSKHTAMTEAQYKKILSLALNNSALVSYRCTADDITDLSFRAQCASDNYRLCAPDRYSHMRNTVEIKRIASVVNKVNCKGNRTVFEIGKISDTCYEIRTIPTVAELVATASVKADVYFKEKWTACYFFRFASFDAMLSALAEYIAMYNKCFDNIETKATAKRTAKRTA